jgi:CBS domain-containing protein
MSSPLIAVSPDETVWEAAQIMKTKNIHKLPAKQNGKIVGIVTTTDLVKICSLGSDSEMRRICDQIITRMEQNK